MSILWNKTPMSKLLRLLHKLQIDGLQEAIWAENFKSIIYEMQEFETLYLNEFKKDIGDDD